MYNLIPFRCKLRCVLFLWVTKKKKQVMRVENYWLLLDDEKSRGEKHKGPGPQKMCVEIDHSVNYNVNI